MIYNNEFEVLIKRMDMTYILGARCKDGVILVGDRKVTLAGGADFDYEDKIFMDFPNVVVGSSGVLGLFDKFRTQVTRYVTSHREGMDIQDLAKPRKRSPFQNI